MARTFAAMILVGSLLWLAPAAHAAPCPQASCTTETGVDQATAGLPQDGRSPVPVVLAGMLMVGSSLTAIASRRKLSITRREARVAGAPARRATVDRSPARQLTT